jgi:hypothetical protein
MYSSNDMESLSILLVASEPWFCCSVALPMSAFKKRGVWMSRGESGSVVRQQPQVLAHSFLSGSRLDLMDEQQTVQSDVSRAIQRPQYSRGYSGPFIWAFSRITV